MPPLSGLLPKGCPRIIDLVKEAGVDVSDWSNFKGGKQKAATNPKYCYEWSFVEQNKVVVLNLLYGGLKERDGKIVYYFNMREEAKQCSKVASRRAKKMDIAIQEAKKNNLPVRIIILVGKRRGKKGTLQVKGRRLDSATWSVTKYDSKTGEGTITRAKYADQFEIPQEQEQSVKKHAVSGTVFSRDPGVRKRVLERAHGKCELCSKPGFKMADGRTYLETHHIIPLAEQGKDIEENVIGLCPNHHRKAHYGKDCLELRKKLRKKLRVKYDEAATLQLQGRGKSRHRSINKKYESRMLQA